MANWLQRTLIKMAGAQIEPAAETARGAQAQGAQAADYSLAYVAAVKAWGDTWLSGGDVGATRSIVYSDSATGRISAVRYNTWAGNCVNARASSVASVPVRLYRSPADPDEDPELVTDHPIVELLRQVNPVNLDETSYREQVERQKAIHGEAYTYKVRGSDGKPSELYILPAHLVSVLSDERGFVTGYKYQGRVYPIEDVIRDYYPDDYDQRLARSPTSLALESINRYRLADMSQEAIDMRGGQGGGIVSLDFNQVAGDVERFKAEWDARRADPRNAGRDAFVPPGAKYESGVLTAQQQQREERSSRLISEIMAAYSVPPSMAGDYSDASVLANAAQQNKNFWETWGIGECKHLAETLTNYLLWVEWEGSRDEGLYLAPDLSVVLALAEDQVLQGQREQVKVETTITMLQGGTISVNEARVSLGYEPIDDPRADDVLLLTAGGGAAKPVEPAVEPVEQQPEVEPATVEPATKSRLISFFDMVGQTARLPSGETGRIEAVKRFGVFGDVTATATEPVVIVAGKAYRAGDIQVVLEV